MSKFLKIAIGIFTVIWPAVAIGGAFAIFWCFPKFRYSFVVSFAITAFAIACLFIYTVTHAVKNDRFSGPNGMRWIMFFLFANWLAVPVYWYLYIWPGKSQDIK